MKKKTSKVATKTWAFIVSLSVAAATAVMAQQPDELPEQAAVSLPSAPAAQ